jgi:UDP-glucose 4-epimerase
VATWVIGSGGLLGSAVCRELKRAGRVVVTWDIPWEDPTAALAAMRAGLQTLLDLGVPWRIVWSAGAGVVGTSPTQLDEEIEVLTAFLSQLHTHLLAHPSSQRSQPSGALFVASSAGGVYAGSEEPPFSELTEPHPISPYGRAKLAAEKIAEDFARASGVPTFIGRIANLYGPGQDIAKPQGLISQLCRAHLTRQPLSIYVPLDTARDYLFVDDAARMVIAGLEQAVRSHDSTPGAHLKVLASQRPTSVAAILAELRRVTRRRPQVILGSSPNARYQVRDLRLRSVVWPALDRCTRTTLAAGMAATLESLGHEMRAGRLSRP